MNINMFFEFPGILITIGVVLLIISILIILIAIRTDKKAEIDFAASENEAFDNKENKEEISKEEPIEEVNEDNSSSDKELSKPLEEENSDDDIELL